MCDKIDLCIHQIEQSISSNRQLLSSVTIKDGIIGLSIFYFYYARYTGKAEHLQKVADYLETCFEGLEQHQLKDFELCDLVELGRYLLFLFRENLLEVETITAYLDEIDAFIKEVLQREIDNKNLNTVLGVIGAGHYFVEGNGLKDYSTELNDIIQLISTAAHVDSDGSIFWYFNSSHHGNLQVRRFGTTNGQAGIIFFLLRLYEHDFKREICADMIHKGLQNLIKYRLAEGYVRLYPFGSAPESQEPLQNLAYGDVGIGNVFYQCGELFDNDYYRREGIKIIENAARFRDDAQKYIKDAQLLHGAAGLLSIFNRYKQLIKSESISASSAHWLEEVLNFNKSTTPWAGFDTYYNGYSDHFQISFAYGISGIGIALIGHKLSLPSDYLIFFNY
ncbi:lanthionine synthetase LanC family protein [Chitinophaga sp. 22321]|uniref:Lanthionine synthetase C-like protein n=1 Tax=Chitinophaga hostae TaxID=2831022 RepID=A0ABS5IS00_9BACT|nr:lanthionine synthetase LanC family protein [Chitinophaga hostae]MBS0025732.1 hypothetical protein [Chitinophaga hostae]